MIKEIEDSLRLFVNCEDAPRIVPIELQNHFAKIIEKIEKQKQLAQKSLGKSEELFQSLLQRAFEGELV